MNVLDISDTESEELFVAMIEKSVNTIQTMIINNVPIKFQLDTGAKLRHPIHEIGRDTYFDVIEE